MISESFSAFVFDFDGTLIDTAADILDVLRGVIADAGLPVPAMNNRFIGPPLEDIVANAVPCINEKIRAELILAYRTRYRVCRYEKSRIYPGIPRVLHSLREAGIPIFVATNKPHAVTRRFLDLKGLLPFFTDTISRDSHPGTMLSKTEMLDCLVQKHGLLVSHCVMVGDSLLDMEGGRTAGMKTMAALYGYTSPAALRQTSPDYIVEDGTWTVIRSGRDGMPVEILP